MAIAKAIYAYAVSDISRLVALVLLCGGTVLLLVLQREVPTSLWVLDGSVITFFFAVPVGEKLR